MHDVLYSLLLALLAGTLLLGSCGLAGNDENGRKTQVDSTYFRTTLNGEEAWSAGGTKGNYLFSEEGYTWLSISGGYRPESNTKYSYTEILELLVIFRGTGTYALVEDRPEGTNNVVGSEFRETGGDVIYHTYSPIDDSLTNQLTITSYDSTTSLIEGTFHTTVVVDSAPEPGEPSQRRPDTLRFTDGEFRVNVRDQRDE